VGFVSHVAVAAPVPWVNNEISMRALNARTPTGRQGREGEGEGEGKRESPQRKAITSDFHFQIRKPRFTDLSM